MADRDVRVRVTGDTSGFERAMGSAAGSVDRFGSGFGRATRGILAAGAGVFAVDRVLDFGSAMLDAGTQVQTWGIKVDTVFGDSAASIRTWADENNEALGVTDDALAGMAAGLGDLLVPLGFTRDQAAQMSTTSLDLAGALSAWSGGTKSVTDVSETLTAAMLGETDGLKSLGISIGAADIQQRLMEQGQQDLTGSALAQAEAQATLDLILEKSTDAQAAWADGSMDAIQNQNELTATTAELRESIAVALLPALQGLVDTLVTRVIPGVRDLAATWAPRLSAAWDAMQPALIAIGETMRNVAEAVLPVLVDGFRAAAEWVQTNWPAIRDTVADVLASVEQVIRAAVAVITAVWQNFGDLIIRYVALAWDAISATIRNALEVVRGVIQTVTAIIRGDWGAAWEGIRMVVGAIWDQIGVTIRTAIEAVRLYIDVALRAIGLVWSTVWSGIRTTVGAIVDGIRDRVVAVLGALRDRMGEIITAAAALVAAAFRTMRDTVVAVVDGIRDRVVAIFAAIRDRAGELITAAAATVTSAFQGMRETVVAVVDGIRDRVVDIFGAIRDRIGSIIDTATSNAVGAFRGMREAVNEVLQNLRDGVLNIFDGLRDRVGNVIEAIVSRVRGGFQNLRDAVMGPIDAIRAAVDGLISAIGRIPTSIPNPLGGIDIPFFADGGLVTRPTVGLIGEAGPELVLPLSRPARMAELLRSVGLDGAAGPRFAPLPELAGGSSSSGAQVININVTALTAEAARSYAGIISDELRRLDRSAS